MNKYVAKRNDLCIGSVVSPVNVNTQMNANGNIKNIDFLAEKSRGILFTNDSNCANDLIWQYNNKYPVIDKINNLDDTDFILRTNRFVVEDYIELNDILKYLKYNQDLKKSDLYEIYHILITNPLFNLRASEQTLSKLSGKFDIEKIDRLRAVGMIGRGKPSKEEQRYQTFNKR